MACHLAVGANTLLSTEMTKKFESRLEVMRVRQNFAAPYLKYRFLFVQKPDLKDKKSFVTRIQRVCTSWPPGVYYLKLADGAVFSRFEVSDGRVKKIYENSPATNKPYPITEFFKVN